MPIFDTTADDLRHRIAVVKSLSPQSPSMERMRASTLRDLERELQEAIALETLMKEYA